MTRLERILILLTESGLVYAGIWVRTWWITPPYRNSHEFAHVGKVFVVAYQVGEMNPHIYNDGASSMSYWLVAGYFVDGILVPLIVSLPTKHACLVLEPAFAFRVTNMIFSGHIPNVHHRCRRAQTVGDGELLRYRDRGQQHPHISLLPDRTPGFGVVAIDTQRSTDYEL